MSAKGISISGSGKIEEGEYGEIHISGSGKGTGEIRCESLHISGSGRFSGDMDAGDCRVSGSANFDGNLKCGDFHVSGSTKVEGALDVLSMSVSGSLRVSGGISGKKGSVSGSVHTDQGMEFEALEIRGGFRCGSLMNVGNLIITLGGACSAPEIGGEAITVQRRSDTGNLLSALFGVRTACALCAETIEGTSVSLEYTTADIVRGQVVNIGPGCHIRRVEYTDSLSIDRDASVSEQEKL